MVTVSTVMGVCINVLWLLVMWRDRRRSLSRQIAVNLLLGVWLDGAARRVLAARNDASHRLHAVLRGDAIAFAAVSSDLVVGSVVRVAQVALRLAVIDHQDFLHFAVVEVV